MVSWYEPIKTLYNLHADSESLRLSKEAHEYVPNLFWDRYKDKPEELKKREAAIATEAQFAYYYANYILEGAFPAGEEAIATDTWRAYCYALNVLKGPFALGEAAISKSAEPAFDYAHDVLKGPFPAGEAAIATNPGWALAYATTVLKADFYCNGKLIAKFEK